MIRLGGKLVIGVVHLLPLPGSPHYGGSRQAIRSAARRDATAYLEGGCHGIIVENHGDGPFFKRNVGASVIAEMTGAASELISLLDDQHSLGINVLRNDATAALSIAAAVGAHFIRVNVHTGSMYTDQGLIEGEAAETLRLRRTIETDVAIFADIAVKHAIPPAGFDRARAARDCVGRGGADALIVTGTATGAAAADDDILEVKNAAPKHPVLVGSGVTAETVGAILALADGVIVGTSLKEDGDVHKPVDPKRVAEFMVNAK